MKLTNETIAKLAAKPGAKRNAVENFLMTAHYSETKQGALMDLATDAHMYDWNQTTINAIQEGIEILFTEGN